MPSASDAAPPGDGPGTVGADVSPEPAVLGEDTQPLGVTVRGNPRPELAAWAFAAMTVSPVLILLAWLVTGLALLLTGRFLLVPMLLISVPLAGGVITVTTARSVPVGWLMADLGRWAGRSRARPWVSWWGLAGTAAAAVGFAVWQWLLASPSLIVDRAPGVATQAAFWIADNGSLPITGSLAFFGGAHPGLALASYGFAAHGSGLLPTVAPGLPIVLAAGLWAHALPGAAVVSPILGAIAIFAVGGLTGRLAGPQWAPVGAVLLGACLPEIYTSRSGFTEILAQALLFGGLCLVVDGLGPGRSRVIAALGGFVLGMAVLADPAVAIALLPAISFLGVMAASGRGQSLALGAGLAGGVALALAGDAALASASTLTEAFGNAGWPVLGFTLATAIGVVVGVVRPVRRRVAGWLAARPLRWLPDVAAGLVIAVMVGFAIRPYLQTVQGPANAYIAGLQRMAYLVPQPGRRYAEDSFYWVVWYAGAPALALGVAGLALLARRCLRALLSWRDPVGAARAAALPLGVTMWAAITVLWQPATVPDQPWASRRLVPVVLPGLIVFAVWMAGWLIARSRRRGAGLVPLVAAVACFVVALGAPVAATTFGVGAIWNGQPGLGPVPGGVGTHPTGAGQVLAVGRVCGAIPPRSSVIIVDSVAARQFTEVIRGMCGVPVGVMAGASRAQVQAVIAGIERSGRRPVLFSATQAGLAPFLVPARRVVDLVTQQDAHVLTQPPASTWPVRYQLWMSLPGRTAGAGTA